MPSWEAVKLKTVVPGGGRLEIGEPAVEYGCVAGLQCFGEQGCEAELIDHLGFIAVAVVADVLFVGDVGFGQEDRAGCHLVDNGAHEFDDFVRLGQVDAGGSQLFPEIGDGIESDDAGRRVGDRTGGRRSFRRACRATRS